MNQTSPQNKLDSSQVPVILGFIQWASSFSYKWQTNTQSQNSLSWFPSVSCSVLKDHPGSSQLQISGQYLDFSLADDARTQWPWRRRWSAGPWLVHRFRPGKTGHPPCCQICVHVSGDRTQPCSPPGSDGRLSAHHSHLRGSIGTGHSRKEAGRMANKSTSSTKMLHLQLLSQGKW